MQGQVIINKYIGTISDKYVDNINISSLMNGQYMIELTINDNTTSYRIIKK
jgi:hypothetical protein